MWFYINLFENYDNVNSFLGNSNLPKRSNLVAFRGSVDAYGWFILVEICWRTGLTLRIHSVTTGQVKLSHTLFMSSMRQKGSG